MNPEITECPECQAEVQAGSKFCNECGAKIPQPAATPSGDGVQIGEKAVVAGDVTGGDKVEMKSHGGAQHFHQAAKDETKEVQRCAACGGRRQTVEGHDCPGCNSFVCNECYHTEEERCALCEKEAVEKYQGRLAEVYADGNVGGSEREGLTILAGELHISKDRARELEAPLRNRGGGAEGELSRMARVTFNKARLTFKPLFPLPQQHLHQSR